LFKLIGEIQLKLGQFPKKKIQGEMVMNNKKSSRFRASQISRRDFIAGTCAASVFSIIPQYVLGGAGQAPPSERVNIAVIGTGGQGIVNIKNLLRRKDVRIIAIADPNEESDYSRFYYKGTGGRKPALKLINDFYAQENSAKSFKKCTPYIDFRKMFDREKAIDAVLVATPDHVHAVVTMAAINRGKHVYCEKPLAHSVYEVRQVTEAAHRAGVATQMGNHGHSGEGIRLTCEWIWDGAIGAIKEVHAWTGGGGRFTVDKRPEEIPPVPVGLQWDLWLGPAPYRPYHPYYHPYTWRNWWAFGTGGIGDMGCHNIDPAFWALKLGYPVSVETINTKVTKEVTPQSSTIKYEFPARGDLPPVTLTWYDGNHRPPRPEELEPKRRLGGNGILFIGEKGKILCGGWGGSPRLIPESKMKEYQRPHKTLLRSKGHHRDWLDACKGGKPATASFDYTGPLAEMVLLGNVAQRIGKKIIWDGKNLKVTNIPEANKYVRSPYRTGWDLNHT